MSINSKKVEAKVQAERSKEARGLFHATLA